MVDNLLAEIHDYPSLIVALRARARDRQIAIGGASATRVAGLSDGYLARLLSPAALKSAMGGRKHGDGGVRIGLNTLGPILGLLGVRLVMVEDAEAMARYGPRVDVSKRRVQSKTVHIVWSAAQMRKNQAKGGRNSRKNMTKKAASMLGRKAARERWTKSKSRPGGCPDAPDL